MDKGGFVGKAMFAYRYSHRPAVWMRRLTRAGFLSPDAHRPGESRRRGGEGQVKGGGLEDLRKRRIKAVIPEKKDQAANRRKKGGGGGRPVSHDTEPHKERHTVVR
ncbi:hypothetical protein HEK131_39780 [Streptomyces seoulensis]|nr:hypothetical protein HEK131_39780 [Streptomyces seoulensis]